jgi:hypothetical protein
MSQLIVTTPTRAPVYRVRSDTDQIDRRAERRRARLWTVIEALAYAGALVDPSGVLAVERLRQAKEEAGRNGRR